jgi:hypothetical protein
VRIPAFIVVGGGRTGAGYVRQLLHAVERGQLSTDAIHVVDRNAACAARTQAGGPRVVFEVGEWADWLDRHLTAFPPAAHFVPYHWAPHLLLGWLRHELEQGGTATGRGALAPAFGVPYQATTAAGDRALSYATWICPPTCIEPALCPHTRGPKSWSLAGDLDATPPGFDGSVVFRCLHLLRGIGTIPLAQIFAARDRLAAEARPRHRRYLVATSSHCHALATVLEVWRATTA